MLESITKHITDNSSESDFKFSFQCDICSNTWVSIPIKFNWESGGNSENEKTKNLLWQSEHTAAYERANREAMMHFNRCPICKRWVCDDCFLILKEADVCKECESKQPG